MKNKLLFATLSLTALSLSYTGCKKKDSPAEEEPPVTTPATQTLYQRVGGTDMVADPHNASQQIEKGRLTLRSVVDSAIFVIAGDPQLNPYFGTLLTEVGTGNTTGFAALSKNFTDFLCTATGATNASYQYTGKSMHAAHNHTDNPRMGMKVSTEADFNKFVADIGIALSKNGVNSSNNAALVNDLVALLNTTKNDVIQTPADPTLYARVGGSTMVADPKNSGQQIEQGRLTLRSVVDSAIFVIAGDNQLNPYFATLLAEVGNNNTTGFAALSKNFTDFLCSATGCTNPAYGYTGKNMKDAHNPVTNTRMAMKANSADFDKFVGDIGVALGKNGVNSSNNADLVNALVGLLYTQKSIVVQR